MKTTAVLSLLVAIAIAGCGDPDAAAKASVKSQLSDPNSAEFRNIRRSGKVTCGEVNAKNKQGGYDGFKAFLISKEQGAIIRPDGELSPGSRELFGPTLAGPSVDGAAFDRLSQQICPKH